MKQTNPHHSHDNCLALFERLSEYIDKEVDTPTGKDIEAHIKACKPCQVCLETLKQTVDLCRNLERSQVPETLSLKLKETISALMNKPTD